MLIRRRRPKRAFKIAKAPAPTCAPVAPVAAPIASGAPEKTWGGGGGTVPAPIIAPMPAPRAAPTLMLAPMIAPIPEPFIPPAPAAIISEPEEVPRAVAKRPSSRRSLVAAAREAQGSAVIWGTFLLCIAGFAEFVYLLSV
jgi:hypothetical protein